ncbi:MAG TPA: ATP-binding protein, partial [Planctomycetota bacterium]|nr:ATP-binding protein [Planctomycetota bacterium]
ASAVVLGRHDRPLHVEGPEEVVELARTVDQMRSALVEQVERLGAEQTLLRTMVDGLEEGLLLVDPDRRVLLLNKSLLELLRVDVLGRDQRVGEVIRHPVVIERVVQCLAEGKEQRATLKGLGGTNRSFELHVVSVALPEESSRRGALALFFDITRLEALERVRQQFIADVSHELRTPVTSIKGALETLVESLETISPTDRKFLDMASRQADRMSELISDLTDLSRIETGAITLNPRLLDLRALVHVVVETVLTRRKALAAEIVVRVEEGITVFADSRRLEQVLLNLVDNAVKFSGAGSRVEVGAEVAPKWVRILVDDSGPGIPEEHREQVFTRFFRVDKGRTREAGGTGLGLSIVKHLVKLHRGAVWVEKGPLGGARFVVELTRQGEISR